MHDACVLFLCGQGGVGKKTVAQELARYGFEAVMIKLEEQRAFVCRHLKRLLSDFKEEDLLPGTKAFADAYDRMLLSVVSKRGYSKQRVTKLRFFYEYPGKEFVPIWEKVDKSLFLQHLSTRGHNIHNFILLEAPLAIVRDRRVQKMRAHDVAINSETASLLDRQRIRSSRLLERQGYGALCALLGQKQIIVNTAALSAEETARTITRILSKKASR